MSKLSLVTLRPGIELIKDRGILYEGQTLKYDGCDFYFPGSSLNKKSCPVMARPVCYMYNGHLCCASKCPGEKFKVFLSRSQA